MKLLDRYNRVSLITTTIIIIITGFIYYETISYILTQQVDKDLLVEENEIFDYVKLNGRLPQVFKSDDLKIRFSPVNKDTVERRFADIQIYNDQDKESESARSLTSSVDISGQVYRIVITESKVETDDLIRLIFLITLGIIFVLLLVIFVVNRLALRSLWQPFYQMLFEIKQFNLADQSEITPLSTEVEEFRDLNLEITAMSQRVTKDYRLLKGFVENAAHELMTPIAVLNSKLDTLVQEIEFDDKQGALFDEVYKTMGKMKRLNKSMLMLARIENKLFHEQNRLELSEKIDEKMNEFQDLIASKKIKTKVSLKPVTVAFNVDLLNILLNNLIGNAILHNYEGGELMVDLSERTLSVYNTGGPNRLDDQFIFQRFYKSAESEGTGLGLTLVKEICDSYNIRLEYHYALSLHCFTMTFMPDHSIFQQNRQII